MAIPTIELGIRIARLRPCHARRNTQTLTTSCTMRMGNVIDAACTGGAGPPLALHYAMEAASPTEPIRLTGPHRLALADVDHHRLPGGVCACVQIKPN